ncbi:uncharacterized protein LOC132268911 [Cornus florida]|uniref:uncharacterized protein LOC132268911 n=1 Tax=Cornus florida TaxID=4283 RepID=UPI002899F1C3|nr:uncharacterized protein LOC132268911 [Cornus florida]
MADYLMASHGYPPGLVFHQQQGSCRVSKDYQPLLPCPGSQDIMRPSSFNLSLRQSEEPWKHISGSSEANQFIRIDSTIRRPVLIDVKDTHPNSILFSFGIAQQCTRHEKILQFLMSGSSEAERGGLDLSVLSDLMGLEALTINIHQQPYAPDHRSWFHYAGAQPSLIYPSSEVCSPKPLVDLVGDLASSPEVMLQRQPDGQVSFMGSGTEMKDILSVIVGLYLSKNSTTGRKQSMLVPHFNRVDTSDLRDKIRASSLTLETVKVAPLKSPEKTKLKPSSKKKTNKKVARERDLYRKNYFHACESLLSIMINKKRHGKTTILVLKKSGPELPQFLTQFSATIAGTGLAVLFSVICKVASGRVPLCTSRLVSTGFGFGLVWLSWALNKLRDTIIYISKNSGKLDLKEEEMMWKLDKSVKEIFFRAATVMAVAVLRFA